MIKNDKGRIVISSMISEITFPWLDICFYQSSFKYHYNSIGKRTKSVNSNVKTVIVEPVFIKLDSMKRYAR